MEEVQEIVLLAQSPVGYDMYLPEYYRVTRVTEVKGLVEYWGYFDKKLLSSYNEYGV